MYSCDHSAMIWPAKSSLFLLFTVIFHLVDFSLAGVLAPEVEEAIPGRRNGISPELFNSLEELSRLVDISYCVGTTGVQNPFECLSHCNEFQGFELVTTWNTGPLLSDSCGYIALSHPPFPKRIIVAFRGTYSITNTIVDLSALPQAYVPYTGDADEDVVKGTPRCLNCTVHAGFMDSWRNARPTVLGHVSAAREQYSDYDVVLVGHSLGGAVAALAGAEMRLRGWEPQVTTFGEPRVGNQAFVKFLDRLFGLNVPQRRSLLVENRTQLEFRRVTHANDPVPLLPLEEWGYKMHAGEIFISKPDLSPSISDIQICHGDQDAQCIAGADDDKSLSSMLNELGGGRHPVWTEHSMKQAILSSEGQTGSILGYTEQPEFHQQWSLLPSRYRLWELFFAHRDYFSRIGLCVPGGDPTGLGA